MKISLDLVAEFLEGDILYVEKVVNVLASMPEASDEEIAYKILGIEKK